MKIALVSQEFPPESAKGGIGTQTYLKAKGLAELGHTIFVISRSTTNTRVENTDQNITVIRIPGFDRQIPEMTDIVQWITYSSSVASELYFLNKKMQLDLIDFPEWAGEGLIYLLNRNTWSYVPVVIQLHGPLVMFGHTLNWPDRNSIFFKHGTYMEATCISLADSIYSSSKCSADWIRKYYDPSKGEIPVIHSGIELKDEEQVENSTRHRPTIIFAGKIVSNKGVEELTEACAKLVFKYKNLRLKYLGKIEQSMQTKLFKLAGIYSATEMLEFEGFVEKEKLTAHFKNADIFAAPSWYEGGPGFVYLEAMANGLPVIACSGSGVEEIITNGENGYLIEPKNIEQLINKIDILLSDENKREKMGKKALEFVAENADTTKCIKTLEKYYQSVINKSVGKIELSTN